MLIAVCIRVRLLFFRCMVLVSVCASTHATWAQVPEDPQVVEAPVAVDVVVVDVAGVEVAVDAVEAVGAAVIEEGFAVAGAAVQILAMRVGDAQGSKLQSKVAVDNALVRRVCKPDAEQLKKLNELDAKWVRGKAAAVKQAGNLAAGVLRVFAGPIGVGVQPDNPAEAAKRVTTAYRTQLAEILTPEQLAEYEKHVKEREAFRRQANAACIVSILEQRVSLTDQQGKELAKSLTEWSGIQNMQATFYFQNQAYIPNLPAATLKTLTATQRKILDGMQKADFQFEMFDDGQEAIFITR